MNRNKQMTRVILFMLPMLAILLAGMYSWSWQDKSEDAVSEAMSISLDSGFYNEDLILTINVPAGASVYYTTNSGVPTRENGKRYEEPIPIVASEEELVHVYRFKAYYPDGNESEVITKTYFVGTNIDTRYTTNVLHITGDPDDLFGYEKGIFVPGKIYDEYMKKKPDSEYNAQIEANFMMKGADWEREVAIAYFSKEGDTLFAVNGGVRICGAYSRLNTQKSFRLYARKEYDVENEFEFPVISKLVTPDGTVAQEHKRLTVRNSADDNGYAFVRNELVARLASDAGFPDVTFADPICVYINGEYWGFYWIENTFDAQYFENKYGAYTGEFVVLEGGDPVKTPEEDERLQCYVDEYNGFYNKFAAMDLTVDANYQELEKILDVENYLQYFAIENYIGNMDWPDNNLKVYRYVAEDGIYLENTVFDGRYRHLLFDSDYGFGYLERVGYDAGTDTLIMDLEGSPLFSALMKREECRDYFMSYSCDLMNGAMSLENVSETLAELHASRTEELYYMIRNTTLAEDLYGEEGCNVVEEGCNIIRRYAEDRPGAILWDGMMNLGYDMDAAYELYINKNCVSTIQVNSLTMDAAQFVGKYIRDIPVTLTPNLVKNENFVHWVVNGEIREEEKLVVTAEDLVDYQVTVELVTETVEEPVLQLQAVRAKGKSDYIELVNLSDSAVSTRGYFLSDDEDLYRYPLPNVTLQPGEKRRFYGKNCTDVEGWGQISLNFNIRQGEIITLTYGEEVLEELQIPDLSEDGVYQRVGVTDKFVEVLY